MKLRLKLAQESAVLKPSIDQLIKHALYEFLG